MSPYPKCPVCKHPHAAGSAHIWNDDDTSRDSFAREVTVSGSDPVTAGKIKRTDEAVARQEVTIPTQLVQPSHDIPAHGGTVDAADLKSADQGHGGSSPSVPTKLTLHGVEIIPDKPDHNYITVWPLMSELLARETATPPGLKISTETEAKIESHLESFNRNAYQANYMRDRRKAIKEGLTVSAWRKKHNLDE